MDQADLPRLYHGKLHNLPWKLQFQKLKVTTYLVVVAWHFKVPTHSIVSPTLPSNHGLGKVIKIFSREIEVVKDFSHDSALSNKTIVNQFYILCYRMKPT